MLDFRQAMKVVLTKKLAEQMDGVDVRGCEVGDVLDLPSRDARALVAEEWAIPDRRHRIDPVPRVERRRPSREAQHEDDLERAS